MKSLIFGVTMIGLSFVVFKISNGVFGQEVARENVKIRPEIMDNMDYLPLLPPRVIHSIGLNNNQEKQVADIVRSLHPEMKAIGDRVREADCALDLAILSEQLDEAQISRYKEARAKAEAEMAGLRITVYGQLQKLFTREQVARYNELNRERLVGDDVGVSWEGGPLLPILRLSLNEVGSLSSAQLRKIDDILRSHGEGMRADRHREELSHYKLDEAAISADSNQETISQRQEDNRQALAKLVERDADILMQVRQVLTPQQLARLRKIKADNCAQRRY